MISASAKRVPGGSAAYQAMAAAPGPDFGVSRLSARYAPNAKSEPWARLMTSITPRISMNPSAISANRSPRLTPLTRCGSRSVTRPIAG